jgi:hypothetical protein
LGWAYSSLPWQALFGFWRTYKTSDPNSKKTAWNYRAVFFLTEPYKIVVMLKLNKLELKLVRPLAALLLCAAIVLVYFIATSSHHPINLYGEINSLPPPTGCEKGQLVEQKNSSGGAYAWVLGYNCHVLKGTALNSLSDNLGPKGFKPVFNPTFTKPNGGYIPNEFLFKNSSFLLLYSFNSLGSDNNGLNSQFTPVYNMELFLYSAKNNPYD